MYCLSNFCFLCLHNNTNLVSINNHDGDKKTLYEKLKYCMKDLKIIKPVSKTKICKICADILRMSFEFQRKCRENNKTLLCYVQQLSKNSGKCCEIFVLLNDVEYRKKCDSENIIIIDDDEQQDGDIDNDGQQDGDHVKLSPENDMYKYLSMYDLVKLFPKRTQKENVAETLLDNKTDKSETKKKLLMMKPVKVVIEKLDDKIIDNLQRHDYSTSEDEKEISEVTFLPKQNLTLISKIQKLDELIEKAEKECDFQKSSVLQSASSGIPPQESVQTQIQKSPVLQSGLSGIPPQESVQTQIKKSPVLRSGLSGMPPQESGLIQAEKSPVLQNVSSGIPLQESSQMQIEQTPVLKNMLCNIPRKEPTQIQVEQLLVSQNMSGIPPQENVQRQNANLFILPKISSGIPPKETSEIPVQNTIFYPNISSGIPSKDEFHRLFSNSQIQIENSTVLQNVSSGIPPQESMQSQIKKSPVIQNVSSGIPLQESVQCQIQKSLVIPNFSTSQIQKSPALQNISSGIPSQESVQSQIQKSPVIPNVLSGLPPQESVQSQIKNLAVLQYVSSDIPPKETTQIPNQNAPFYRNNSLVPPSKDSFQLRFLNSQISPRQSSVLQNIPSGIPPKETAQILNQNSPFSRNITSDIPPKDSFQLRFLNSQIQKRQTSVLQTVSSGIPPKVTPQIPVQNSTVFRTILSGVPIKETAQIPVQNPQFCRNTSSVIHPKDGFQINFLNSQIKYLNTTIAQSISSSIPTKGAPVFLNTSLSKPSNDRVQIQFVNSPVLQNISPGIPPQETSKIPIQNSTVFPSILPGIPSKETPQTPVVTSQFFQTIPPKLQPNKVENPLVLQSTSSSKPPKERLQFKIVSTQIVRNSGVPPSETTQILPSSSKETPPVSSNCSTDIDESSSDSSIDGFLSPDEQIDDIHEINIFTEEEKLHYKLIRDAFLQKEDPKPINTIGDLLNSLIEDDFKKNVTSKKKEKILKKCCKMSKDELFKNKNYIKSLLVSLLRKSIKGSSKEQSKAIGSIEPVDFEDLINAVPIDKTVPKPTNSKPTALNLGIKEVWTQSNKGIGEQSKSVQIKRLIFKKHPQLKDIYVNSEIDCNTTNNLYLSNKLVSSLMPLPNKETILKEQLLQEVKIAEETMVPEDENCDYKESVPENPFEMNMPEDSTNYEIVIKKEEDSSYNLIEDSQQIPDVTLELIDPEVELGTENEKKRTAEYVTNEAKKLRTMDDNVANLLITNVRSVNSPETVQQQQLTDVEDSSGPDLNIHRCSVCSKPFLSAANLKQHMYYNHPKNYECSICHKKFKFKYCLKRHLNVHKGENVFLCPFCPLQYGHIHGLKKHCEVVHSYVPLNFDSRQFKGSGNSVD